MCCSKIFAHAVALANILMLFLGLSLVALDFCYKFSSVAVLFGVVSQ